MKQLITNPNMLLDADITETVKRVKALIINFQDEILLGYCHSTHQFLGGLVEADENLSRALKRELLEEAGLNLCVSNLNPFACAVGYYKN